MEEEKLTKKVTDPERPLTRRERKELARAEREKQMKNEAKKGTTKKAFTWLIVLALLGFLGYKIYKWWTEPVTPVSQETFQVRADDNVKGNREASNILIEYGDFQCPACAAYAVSVSQLAEDFSDSLAVVYRHFPLISIHKNAIPSARAAEAAGMQGKFWEMHDLLYANQSEWENESDPMDKFKDYAQTLELDLDKFSADYESDAVVKEVQNDLSESLRLNLNSTPTFYYNGTKLRTPRNYDDFKSLIEEGMKNE